MSQRTPLAILALIALFMQAGCYLITPVRRGGGGDDDDDQVANDDDAVGDDDDAVGDDDDDSIPDGDDDDTTPPHGDDDDDDTPPPVSGPLCDIADEFECGVSNSGNNSGSSIEDTWAQCVNYGAGYTGGEAVFEWQAASSGSVTVNLNWSDSGADLDLFVLSSCESSNTCLGESSSTNVGESVTVNVSAGNWYYIVVDGWEASATSFTLTTNEDCSGGPVGDDDDDDDTPSGGEYGPPNDWFHTTTLPPGLSGTGWNNGQTPPNFTFIDQNGDQVELYQFYGKVIMLDVFAEWCGPCNEMAPEGEQIWNSHPDIVVLAVMEENSWGGTAGATDAARWESTHSLSHPILGDTSQMLLPQISAYPSFWAIDRTMTIADADFWPSQSYLNSLL